MPKPDASKDYYGILEIKQEASVEEIKKAYHKLAFKWHPDRNHGNEQEAATHFQDVSNAYGILIEPTTKAKYDDARAKLSRPATTPFTSPNNVYNPYANFPPPRPANPPQKSPASAGGAQYAQYTTQTHAPWASAGPKTRPTTSAAEASKAWDSMKQPSTARWPAGSGRPPPPMPPRPRPAAFAPTSSDARPTSKSRAGWSEPDEPRPGHDPAGARRPGPGISRSNTMRMPRKNGFDPNAPGDELPARNVSAYYNVKARQSRPMSYVHPTAPHSAETPQPSQRQSQGFRTTSSEENMGDRLSTPYTIGSGEKTYFSRGHGQNDRPESGSNLSSGWDDHSSRHQHHHHHHHHRHRSASPRMRSPRAEESESSSGSDSEEDEADISKRETLRPRGFRNREPTDASRAQQQSPVPSATNQQRSQPGVTVENEFGHVHEFSKPTKTSTWSHEDSTNGKRQGQYLAPENAGGRRTSTGNISEQSFSPQPSPLQKATTATSEFEPVEKSTSWQQKYGSPQDTTNQRHFEPPPTSGGKAVKYASSLSTTLSKLQILDLVFKSQASEAVARRKLDTFAKPITTQIPFAPKNANIALLSSMNNYDSTDSTSPGKHTGYFDSQNWQERLTQNIFQPNNIPRSGSPNKARGNHNLRVPRKNSVPRRQAAKPARIGSDADSVPSMSSSTESISSGNAMDIDAKTPPSSSMPPPKLPRSRPTSSNGNGHLDLKDLGKTAPFAPSNNTGLGDLNDLGATLPFESKAASTLPSEGVNVHRLALPQPPKAIRPPPNSQAMTKDNWEYYLVFIRKYMAEWNTFNRKMLEHFNARQYGVEHDLSKHWLDGIGEGGLSKYMSWIEEDNRVRAHWDVAIEKHTKAMEEFQRIKKLASTASFVHH